MIDAPRDARTGHTVFTLPDGSTIRIGTVTEDRRHIAVASGPQGPAQACEAATTAQAVEIAARQISTWRAEGRF